MGSVKKKSRLTLIPPLNWQPSLQKVWLEWYKDNSNLPSTTQLCSNFVSRHDHHNIEIKTVFELAGRSFESETDIFIFIPRSFELQTVGMDELQSDLRARVRLAVPVSGEQGASALSSAREALKRVVEHIHEAHDLGEVVVEGAHPLADELVNAAKDLCAVVSETLKQSSVDQIRHLFLGHSLMSTPGACLKSLQDLIEDVRSKGSIISEVRKLLWNPSTNTIGVLHLLDEYLSHLYVQYLATIRFEIDRLNEIPENLDTIEHARLKNELCSSLDQLQEAEAAHRNALGLIREEQNVDEIDRERRLVRISHLKKYFQSSTFLDLSRRTPQKKVGEFFATAGTLMAGVIAAMFEIFGRRHAAEVAVQGMFVIALGVGIYVLRDRLKDWLRNFLSEKARKYLPDCEQQLWANNKSIGFVKEWFRTYSKKKLPSQVLEMRKRASANEMESRLSEDVFHYHKIQALSEMPAVMESGNGTKALHENIRICFDRYLKNMDDPFKEVMELDSWGRLKQSKSHRVYHFYLVATTKFSTAAGKVAHDLCYRIVLDKSGIVRLEEIENVLPKRA